MLEFASPLFCAQMMRQLTRVHVPKHEVREHRSLIKYRKELVGRINKIKNTIRGLFGCQGVEIAKRQPAWYSGRDLISPYGVPQARFRTIGISGGNDRGAGCC
jgi:hypothetical protein